MQGLPVTPLTILFSDLFNPARSRRSTHTVSVTFETVGKLAKREVIFYKSNEIRLGLGLGLDLGLGLPVFVSEVKHFVS